MKYLFCFILTFIALGNEKNSDSNDISNDEIEVYIFMHENCKICQFYTLKLKELHEEFASDKIVFKGIFPAKDAKDENLLAFKTAYEMPFEMVNDKEQIITKRLKATITPEVVVLNKSKDQIIYRGRIDDSYYKIGRRRNVNRTNELFDVLTAIKSNKEIKTENQPAIGCYISLRNFSN